MGKKCDICKSSDCPCPICHGDPANYLGYNHGGIHKPDGSVKCTNCGRQNKRN